jgi:autotransporter-associated beta strand protein
MSYHLRLVSALAAALVAEPIALAQSWIGNGSDSNWSTAANWTGGVPSSSASTTVALAGTKNLSPVQNIAIPFTLNQLIFASGAGAFTLGGSGLNFASNGATTPVITQSSASSEAVTVPLTLANNLTVGGTGAGGVTLAGAISGAGSLTMSVSSTLTLSGAGSSFSGGLFVNSGTVNLGGNNVLTAASPAATLGNGTFNLNGFNQTIGSLTYATNAVGATVATGAGTLTLAGNVTLNGGSSGSTALLNGNVNLGGTVSTFTGNAFTGSTYDMVINAALGGTGSSGLLFTGSGGDWFALNQANTYAGSTTVNSGVLWLTVANALPSTTAVVLNNSSTLNMSPTVTASGVTAGSYSQSIGSLAGGSSAIVTLGSATLTVGNDNSSTAYAGVINGSGSLVKVGTGTLTLSGVNTYSGGTTFSQGVVSVSADSELGATTGGLSFTNGTLQFGAAFNPSASRPISVGVGSGGFDTNGFNVTISQNIGAFGLGVLNKYGAGTLTLSGAASTYASSAGGATSVNGGTLKLGVSTALPSSSNVTVFSGGVLDVGAAATDHDSGARSIGYLQLLAGGEVLFSSASGVNNSSFELTQLLTDGGTVDATALGNSLGGLFFIRPGPSIQINGSTTLLGSTKSVIVNSTGGQLPITIALGGTMTSGMNLVSAQANTDLDPFLVTGGGTLYLTNNASPGYALLNGAVVQVNNARLRVDDLTGVGSHLFVVLDNGTFQYGGPTSTSGTALYITANGGGVDVLNPAATLTVNAINDAPGFGAAGPLTKGGPGTLVIANFDNGCSGLVINAGTVQASSDGTLGLGPITVNAPGTMQYTGTTSSSRTFNLNSGTLSVVANATLTLDGAAVNGGFLRGAGTYVVTNGASLTGGTTFASTTISQTGPGSYTNFTNGGKLTIAPNINGSIAMSGFSNEGSGAIVVGATSALNVADFQTYGSFTVSPAAVTENFSQTTLVTNTGTSPLFFNGGSRTFLGTPSTASFPSNWPDASLRGLPTFVAGLDLHGQNAVVAGGLFVNNGYVEDSTNNFQGTGTIVADFGSLVKGAGYFQNTVITQNGGKFQAGNSPGMATFGQFAFGPGGVSNYVFAIDDATGTGGPTPDAAGLVSGWSLVRVIGTRAPRAGSDKLGDFTWTATPAKKLVVSIETLLNPTTVGSDVVGAMDHFDPTLSYSWPALDWTGSYAGPTDTATLDASTAFDLTDFANPVAGSFGWALDPGDHTLSLTYTPSAVPEPGALALTGLAAALVALRRKKQMSTPDSNPPIP